MKKPLVCAVLSCLCGAVFAGGSIGFRFEADHPDCLYRVGEEAVVTVTATNGAGEAMKDWHCRVEIDNYGRNILGVVAKQEFAKENPFKLRGKLDKPGFLRFRILGKDPEGKWIGCQWGDVSKGREDYFYYGAILGIRAAGRACRRSSRASPATTT